MSVRDFLHLLKRTGLFTLGLFILAIGVAISVRANLGTGPIVAIPSVLSFATPLSMGALTIIVNLVLLAVSIAVSRREFPLIQLVQIPVTFLLGFFVDIAMVLTPWGMPTSYFMQWVWVVISVPVIALGVYIEMKPRLTYIPADGLVALLATVMHKKLGNVKIIFDWSMVIIAVILSVVLLSGLEGVREGTVFAAFGVGMVLKLFANLEQQFRADRRYK